MSSECSSVVERCPDKTEVVGPIPTTLTVDIVYLCEDAFSMEHIKNHFSEYPLVKSILGN